MNRDLTEMALRPDVPIPVFSPGPAGSLGIVYVGHRLRAGPYTVGNTRRGGARSSGILKARGRRAPRSRTFASPESPEVLAMAEPASSLTGLNSQSPAVEHDSTKGSQRPTH